MSIISEFKAFAMKGSLIDMAVGIIIGAAVSKMVSTLVDSILMPVIGIFMGGVDFKDLTITVGEAAIGYGAFIQALIDFLIIALVIFMILKAISKMRESMEKEEAEAETKAEPKSVPADIVLLTEIRDLLKK